MKKTALVIAILLAGALPAAAETAGSAGPGIRAVISAQIDAFRAGDFARAFGYASDGIRQIFATADSSCRLRSVSSSRRRKEPPDCLAMR